MPLPQLGVPQASGIWLAEIEKIWLDSKLETKNLSEIPEIFGELLERGYGQDLDSNMGVGGEFTVMKFHPNMPLG